MGDLPVNGDHSPRPASELADATRLRDDQQDAAATDSSDPGDSDAPDDLGTMPGYDPGRRARWLLLGTTVAGLAISLLIIVPAVRSEQAPPVWQWLVLAGLFTLAGCQHGLWERYAHRNLRLVGWMLLSRVGWVAQWLALFVLMEDVGLGPWKWLVVLALAIVAVAALTWAYRRLPDPVDDATPEPVS